MVKNSIGQNVKPVLKGVSYFLGHVPSMVRHGSKPSREIGKDPSLLPSILSHLETFDQAVAYPPNQVFLGNLDPDDLLERIPSPWYKNPIPNSSRRGPFGEIMPEDEFYGMMKICDEFQLLLMEEGFLKEIALKLKGHPLFTDEDIQKLGKGVLIGQIEKEVREEGAMPIYVQGDRLVGCVRRGHEEDFNLIPDILIENLTSRASGVLALRHLVSKMGELKMLTIFSGVVKRR